MMEMKRAWFLRSLLPYGLTICALTLAPLHSEVLTIGNDRSFVRELQMEEGTLRSVGIDRRQILELGGGRAGSLEVQNTEMVLKLPRKRQNFRGSLEVLGLGKFRADPGQDRCRLTFEANLGAILKNPVYDANTLNLSALRHGTPDAAFLSLSGLDLDAGRTLEDVADIVLANCGNDLNIRPIHDAKIVPVLRVETDGTPPTNLFRVSLLRSLPETNPDAWTGLWIRDGRDWYYAFSLPAFVEVAEPADVDSDLPDLLDKLIPETEAQEEMLAFFIALKNTPDFLPTLRTLTRSCRTEDEAILDELLRTVGQDSETLTVLDPPADYLKHLSLRPLGGYLAEKSVKDLGMHAYYYGGLLTLREWSPLRPLAISCSVGYAQVRPTYVGDILYRSFCGTQRHCLFSCEARYDGRRFLGEFYALGDYVMARSLRRGIQGHHFASDTHFFGCRSVVLAGYSRAIGQKRSSIRSRSIPLLVVTKMGVGYSGLFQRAAEEKAGDPKINAAYGVRRGERKCKNLFLTALVSLEKSIDRRGRLMQLGLRGGFERDVWRHDRQDEDRLAELDYNSTRWDRPRNHGQVGFDLKYQLDRRTVLSLGIAETFSSNPLRNYSLTGMLGHNF